jgi:hypothetical protein
VIFVVESKKNRLLAEKTRFAFCLKLASKTSVEFYKIGLFPSQSGATVLTDDNKVLICTRAQDNGKAIQTPHNNSLIGEYFRRRLGVPFGEPVTIEHLQNYGRTDVDFYKIDDETYFMDFAPRR